MEMYLLDWANLLLRWLHVITAMAWIGASFYFVFLDNSLTPPQDEALRQDGVSGELWAVHGGGFYHPVKYALAPPTLPGHLHWFYWESYATWLSGFALLAVSYLWSPGVYLIDPQVLAWPSHTAAVVSALLCLAVFWLLYDMLCRTVGAHAKSQRWLGLCVALLVCGAAGLVTQLFAGRAAFLLMGAMLATAMTANVAHWIIPGQRKVVAALKAGQPVDPVHGQRGKQRSVHNTYFTLPVVLAMLSNHYSFVTSSPDRAVVLVLLMAAGAAIRQFFVLRHGYKLGRHRHPWPYAVAGVLVLLGVLLALRPQTDGVVLRTPTEQVSHQRMLALTQQRCALCHGAQVQSKGVRLDTLADLLRHAPKVYQQVVVTRQMPLNNATAMTDAERSLVAQWFESGIAVAP